MNKKVSILIAAWAITGFCFAADANEQVDRFKDDVVEIWIEQQYDFVNPHSESALAVHFNLSDDWHFYASGKTAPGGMNLKVEATASERITFSEPIFPPSQMYFDKSSSKKLDVFSNNFTVYLPFVVADINTASDKDIESVKISIAGAICSGFQCRMPVAQLSAEVKIASDTDMGRLRFVLPKADAKAEEADSAAKGQWANYSVSAALALAVLAGLLLNVMPCVWPILPIIVMRILNQAKESKARGITLGLAFCLGIILFFACIAGLNIVLRISYGTVLQWGDLLRNPVFVLVMALLMVILALFMFGVFAIGIPASVTGKAQTGKGYTGSISMGFLAAILGTPCGFAILAAAFAWAQTQTLLLSTVAILLIGVGMAVPYAILTSMPKLLQRLPKPGKWMDMIKLAIGFSLLIIAVKLFEALPQAQLIGTLYFAVVLAFCVWMWGGWVGYDTKPLRKWLVRAIAVSIATVCGIFLLGEPAAELIAWQSYDAGVIKTVGEQDQPVLIDFTADWCLSCKIVDKTVYRNKDIAELIKQKGVLAFHGDTTRFTQPAAIDLKEVYKEPAVPVTVLIIPGRDESVRLRGIAIGDKLKEILKSLEDRKDIQN